MAFSLVFAVFSFVFVFFFFFLCYTLEIFHEFIKLLVLFLNSRLLLYFSKEKANYVIDKWYSVHYNASY